MHLSLPVLTNALVGGALDSDGQSRREAGLVGASLSADVPLAHRIEHAFLIVKSGQILGAVQIFAIEYRRENEGSVFKPRSP